MSAVALVRTMDAGELATVLDWAAAEGWNPGLDDAVRFQEVAPEGFLLATCGGRPAAAISVVSLGPAHGFLGLYICHPDLRGKGYGTAVWNAGMTRMVGRSVGLDGVVAQQGSYARSGFAFAHRTLRFAGTLGVGAGRHSRVAAMSDATAIATLDRRASGLARPDFLRAWLRPGPDRVVRVLDGPDKLRAAGVLRRCRLGWKIGPLLATDVTSAEVLLADFAADAGGAQVMLDVPEANATATALARAAGLAEVFETARMWRGAPPPAEAALVYGVATLELG